MDGNGGVHIGADSAGIAGLSVTVRRDPKVFVRNEVLIGFSGSFRLGQVLQYQLYVPPIEEGMDHHEYLATRFVDSVRTCLLNAGVGRRESETESAAGTFLVGFRGQLYKIEADFQVGISADGYDACGCGEEYALGALYSVIKKMKPEKAIEHALEVATHFSAGVRPPFNIATLRWRPE